MENARNLALLQDAQSKSESRTADEREKLALSSRKNAAEELRYQSLVFAQIERRQSLASALADKNAKDENKRTDEANALAKKRADFAYDLDARNLAARSKLAQEVRARDMAREEKEYTKAEQAAKEHAEKMDAIEKRDRNEYQRRDLQLGAAQELGQVPQLNRPEPVQFITPTPAMLAPNNAGREDVRVPSLLNSIDATLKLISRKETALA